MKKLTLFLWVMFSVNINIGIYVDMEFNELQELLFYVWLFVLFLVSALFAITLSCEHPDKEKSK